MTPAERQRRRRAGLAKRRLPVLHGTVQGYKKHLRGTSDWGAPCAECLAAEAAYRRGRRASE